MSAEATHERRSQLVARWHDGVPCTEIASEFGLASADSARAYVSKLIREGVPLPDRPSGRSGPVPPPRPISPTDAAWAAGFLEADGTFAIVRRGGPSQVAQRQGLLPHIGAAQIDPRPLDRLAALFGGRVYGRDSRTRRGVCQWHVASCARVVNVLEAISPYLVGKTEQAAVLMAFCTGPGSPRPGHRTSREVMAQRLALADQLSALNRGLPVDLATRATQPDAIGAA
jgi:hypothetical protein